MINYFSHPAKFPPETFYLAVTFYQFMSVYFILKKKKTVHFFCFVYTGMKLTWIGEKEFIIHTVFCLSLVPAAGSSVSVRLNFPQKGYIHSR